MGVPLPPRSTARTQAARAASAGRCCTSGSEEPVPAREGGPIAHPAEIRERPEKPHESVTHFDPVLCLSMVTKAVYLARMNYRAVRWKGLVAALSCASIVAALNGPSFAELRQNTGIPSGGNNGLKVPTHSLRGLVDGRGQFPTERVRRYLYLARDCESAERCPGVITISASGKIVD